MLFYSLPFVAFHFLRPASVPSTSLLTIKNVPVGTHRIHFSADSWAYRDKLDQSDSIKITKGAEVAKIVNTPPFGTGYYVVYGISSLVSLITTLYILR